MKNEFAFLRSEKVWSRYEVDKCKKVARRDFERAHVAGLGREAIVFYRSHRRSGDCPCEAMQKALYDWDI